MPYTIVSNNNGLLKKQDYKFSMSAHNSLYNLFSGFSKNRIKTNKIKFTI